MSDRITELERALRAAVMEPGPVSTAYALKVLGLDQYGMPQDIGCKACGRTDWEGECSLCADGRREKLESRRLDYEE